MEKRSTVSGITPCLKTTSVARTKHPAVGLVCLMAAFGLLLCVLPESRAAGDTAPGGEALSRTAKLSTEETVKDIGFPFRHPVTSLIFEPGSLTAWAVYLPENDATIRLIEEGREDPDKIAKLVGALIDESLDLYPENFPGYLEAWRGDWSDIGSLSENDAYYNTHFRYDRPFYEHQRLEYVMPAGFYVLHNIARLKDAEQLKRWIQLERQPGKECKELEVYFIDCFFVDIGSAAGVHGDKHRSLTGDEGIPVGWWVVSKWDQPGEVTEAMLATEEPDKLARETIDIVEIPTRLLSYSEEEARSIAILKSKGLDFDLAQSFSEEELDAIIQNFMDYCDSL